MSLYGLYLSKPSTDAVLLLHMERTCIGVVQWGLFSFFLENWKKKKLKACDMLHKDFYVYNFVLPRCLTVIYYIFMW